MTQTRKSFTNGTHRTRTPEATIAKAQPHLAAMGITRVANVTGLDRIGVPVVNAYRPNSRSLSVSQGKGLTLAAAKASAIMEAVEGYHAEEIDLPVISGDLVEIRARGRVMDLGGLPFLHGTDFDPSARIDWIAGHDLMSGDTVWIPSEMVHTDYTLPRRPNAGCFVASTNGLASGNHPLEAIVHGICEVIERDAHTLWEQMDLPDQAATRLDPQSVTDPGCRTVLDQLDKAGMRVGLWDMSGDVGVATIHCLITDARDAQGHSGGGAGTHLDRNIALLRALTEAVQVRTNYITGARDDLHHDEYGPAGVAAKNRRAGALMSAAGPAAAPVETVPTHLADTLEADLDHLLSRLAAVGIREVVEVPLTKPAFDLPVHRVVIPGLEGPHDHADYSRGPRARARFGGMRR